MSVLATKLDRILESRRVELGLLLAFAGFYTAAYMGNSLFPGNKPGHPEGWWGWWDQSQYLREAVALSRLNFSPEAYHYPVGYSLMGALFVRFMPVNPFFFPDLALILGTACFWWALALRYLSRIQAFVVAAVFIIAHLPVLAKTMVIPFNTIPTQLTLLAAVWVTLTDARPRAVLKLSVLAAATYLIRPLDALCFAPFLVFAVLRLPIGRQRMSSGILGISIVASAVAVTALLNHAIFGTWTSPYEQQSLRDIGFFAFPFSYKLYWILVDGYPLFGETKPGLLFRYPWLFLVIPGAIYWVKKEGAAAGAALLSLGLIWICYLNYNDLLPSDIYRYSLIHYFTGSFLILGLISAAAILRGWRSRSTQAGFTLAALAFLLAVGIRMEEGPLRPVPYMNGLQITAERPLLVKFSNIPLQPSHSIKLDGVLLGEYRHYLLPEILPNLQLLLSSNAKGAVLTVKPLDSVTASATVGMFEWNWRLSSDRLKMLFQ